MATRVPEYRKRQMALREAMRGERLEALAIFGMPAYAQIFSTSGYVRYLTGWTSRYGPSMVVQPAEGSNTLIVPSGFDVDRVRQSFPWVDRCIAQRVGDYGKAARRALLEAGATRVGLVGLSDMPHLLYQDLAGGEGPLALSPAEHLMDEPRLIKDEVEIECHREACRISDRMLGALVERLRGGYRGPGWKLLAEMECTGRSLGAEFATAWLSYGRPPQRQLFALEEMEKEVQDGDLVCTGTYVTFRGYWGHCLRMISLGRPSENSRKLYETVLKAQQAGAARIRSGGDSRLIVQELERVAEELLPGSTDPSQPSRFRHAHFLGLEYADKPTGLAFPQPAGWSEGTAVAAKEITLRPGMVLELHPNLALPGAGFAVMGDMYLVREAGTERLTLFPQDLAIV